MRIVVRSVDVAQFTFGHQTPEHDTGAPGDLQFADAAEQVGMALQIDHYAINAQDLADVARNDVIVIALFLQVIIFALGAGIGQIQGPADTFPDHLVVGIKIEEQLVEGPDMVACLYGNVLPSVGGQCFQSLSTCKHIDLLLHLGNKVQAFEDGKAADRTTGDDRHKTKCPDMPEGRIDIFCFFEHGCRSIGFLLTCP